MTRHPLPSYSRRTSTVQQVSADVHLSVRKTSCSISSVAQKRQALCSGPHPSSATLTSSPNLFTFIKSSPGSSSVVTACVYVYVDAQHLLLLQEHSSRRGKRQAAAADEHLPNASCSLGTFFSQWSSRTLSIFFVQQFIVACEHAHRHPFFRHPVNEPDQH